MGDLFRRFWMPVLLSRELEGADGPPKRATILGEDLLAFRDSQGRVGLVEARCPHRGADLFFGRNEDCGLRCAYPGWKFDVNGDCLDIPTMPKDGATYDSLLARATGVLFTKEELQGWQAVAASAARDRSVANSLRAHPQR